MTLALYDGMQTYACEMVRYLSQKNSSLTAAVFFEKESLMRYCERQTPDILLVQEELADEGIRNLPCGRLVLFKEDGCVPAPQQMQSDVPVRIGRYQSADEIYSQLLLLCHKQENRRTAVSGDTHSTAFTVFYAPGACHEQSALTEQYIRKKQTDGQILYLSLQENAGFSERFRRSCRRDLSDLLYLSRHREGDFGLLLQGFLCEDEGLIYVPPMEQSANAFFLTGQEWRTFFEHLRDESGFREIVFDLEFLFPGAYELLDLSDTVYILTRQGADREYRLRHFLRNCEKRFGREITRKMKEIRLENL